MSMVVTNFRPGCDHDGHHFGSPDQRDPEEHGPEVDLAKVRHLGKFRGKCREA